MSHESSSVIIVKILGAPIKALNALSEINYHSLTKNTVTMTLTPNFNFFKRKALKEVKSKNENSKLTVLNLVFDNSTDPETLQPPSQIGDDKLSYISQRHLASLEEFSSFVISSVLPEIPLPKEFWIPVEALLTQREWDILHLVYLGYSSKKIAAARNLSHRTVELHRQNCAQKVGTITPVLLASLFSNNVLDTYSWATDKVK